MGYAGVGLAGARGPGRNGPGMPVKGSTIEGAKMERGVGGMGHPLKERGGVAYGHVPFLWTVHLAWRAYLITHPWHRGPCKCIGIYLLQCQCSDPLARFHLRDNIWGLISPPFA